MTKQNRQKQLNKSASIKKIGEIIPRNREFLESLAKTQSSHKRRRIIRSAGIEELLSLVEIALNIRKNSIPLRHNQLEKLKCQAGPIRILSRVRTPRSARRILLNSEKGIGGQQSGRGPLAIAGLISSILIPLISEHLQASE